MAKLLYSKGRMMGNDPRIDELYDKQLLHDNIMLYCRAADRMDIEGISSTYWPDSFDDHGGYIGTGHGWANAVDGQRDVIQSCLHHIGNVLCEIEGNRAKRESVAFCVARFKEPDVTMYIGGRFRDLCEKRDGVWKVLRRTVIWDWCDVRKSMPDWDVSGVPEMSNWGDRYPNDPIYKDWFSSPPTARPDYQKP